MWCAAAPGAGLLRDARVPERLPEREAAADASTRRSCWHLYDCTDYAVNLFNLPTVAYSGENDKQKQAADIMAKALKAEGIDAVHIIGPKTGHSYHPEAKAEINRRIDASPTKGRDPLPTQVKFHDLHAALQPQSYWVTIDGLEEHWERARVEARDRSATTTVNVTTEGRHGLHARRCRRARARSTRATPAASSIDRRTRSTCVPAPTRIARGRRTLPQGRRDWAVVDRRDADGLAQAPRPAGPDRRRLHGPLPHGPADRQADERDGRQVGRRARWSTRSTHWRQQFRGEASVKDDTAITDADIADSNLVLWGDPSSNAVLAKIADKLPINWTKDGGDRRRRDVRGRRRTCRC